jgi:hypothetical protein
MNIRVVALNVVICYLACSPGHEYDAHNDGTSIDEVKMDIWEPDIVDADRMECHTAPLGPRCPCVENEECASGTCIDDIPGIGCGVPCTSTTNCREHERCISISAITPLPEYTFCVPIALLACIKCAEDSGCPNGDDIVCLEKDDMGGECAIRCVGSVCPDGYICVDGHGSDKKGCFRNERAICDR